MIITPQIKYTVFFIILLINLIIDNIYSSIFNCIRYNGIYIGVIILLHHIIAVIAYMGWLLPNKYLLLLSIIINISIQLHWITNNDECIMTTYSNKKCNIDKNEPLHDIIFLLHDSDSTINIFGYNIYTEYILLNIFLLLSIYNLYYLL